MKLKHKLEKRARALALEHINHNRSEDGKPPLRRLESGWWKVFGRYWIDFTRGFKTPQTKKKK
jgi:hypothetical protein